MDNPELKRQIIAAPEQADAYLVLGDWLQAQGDPRGKLISTQHASSTTQTRSTFERLRNRYSKSTARPSLIESLGTYTRDTLEFSSADLYGD